MAKTVETGLSPNGKENNWVSVAVNRALDGGAQIRWLTVEMGHSWYNTEGQFQPRIRQNQPTRLGIHNDWVAIGNTWSGVVSLAADGSLWFWPGREL